MPAAAAPSREALPALVERSWRKLSKAGRKLDGGSSDAEYHRVRVLAKRARYGAEAVGPALGKKRGRQAKRFAKRAADLQDALGDLQDSVVAREAIHDVARAHSKAGAFNLAAGQLFERQLRGRLDDRERFPAAWRRLDRKKRLRWM
jgi:CHAD domain-containing protein